MYNRYNNKLVNFSETEEFTSVITSFNLEWLTIAELKYPNWVTKHCIKIYTCLYYTDIVQLKRAIWLF